MKLKFLIFLSLITLCAPLASAQAPQPDPTPFRPRVVATPLPKTTAGTTPTPTATVRVVVVNTLPSPYPTATPRVAPTASPTPVSNYNPYTAGSQGTAAKPLSYAQLKSLIADAKRQMLSKPINTALTDNFLATDIVRIAFYDQTAKQIDFVVLSKESFLSKDPEIQTAVLSSSGKYVTIRIIRANGVNTPVTILGANNQLMVPLLVQYPIEKNGSLAEIAYYTSTHPGVVTPDVVAAGRLYVRNVIDTAREKLRLKGIFISPQVADIAERLSTVEHVDHTRYRTEYPLNVFNDIYTLYALNEGNTYRYSVSSAGAGGMIQMIGPTYYMIRSRYYSVGLIPDFVEGMRNHVNAAQAMLLYMQMTWDDLAGNDTIYNAMSSGTATQAELIAAGYNSNPSNLPAYIRRGGSGWRSLIPRETQLYLEVYSVLEKLVPSPQRTK
jgi:hypothetical protein